MADDVDALGIDRKGAVDRGDEAVEVADVVDAPSVKVAARVRRVPKLVALTTGVPLGYTVRKPRRSASC